MTQPVREIAKVKTAHLGWEDHGIFTCWLDMDFGGAGQGIGLHSLDVPKDDGSGRKRRVGTAYGMEYICRLMRACGVDEWSKLPGRHIYVLRDGEGWNSKVVGIEPLPMESGEPFLFEELRAEFMDGNGEVR